MKKLFALLLAMVMVVSMAACGTTEQLEELDAVLDEAIVELDEATEELDEALAEEEVEEVEEAEEVAATILNWEVVSVISAEGVEMDAESVFGTSMVYAFNTEAGEAAAYVGGEVAAVGTFAELEDETLEIVFDGEAAYGYMDGEYFVVETADGSLQYCSLLVVEEAVEAVEEATEEVATTILNWEVVSVISAEGVEMDAESVFGTSMVYAFNTEAGEAAAYVGGEVAAVGTFAELEDETLEIVFDGEAAYGYMDGEYFVVETADGSLQYCSLMA